MKDAIIIGGGPAGMTAALYLLRAGRSVLILEREGFGGQIAKSPRLENYPSLKALSGSEFSDNLFEQITSLGAEFDLEEVQNVEKEGDHYIVKTDYGTHETKSVIIASGCKHRHLGLEREEELTGKGVSYCAVCDGAFFAGQDVVVIGDANTALQYAILLSKTCSKVYLITLFDRFFADPILVERLKDIQNIEVHHNLNSTAFLGKDQLEGVEFEDTKTKEKASFACQGCFVAIGQIPDNERYSNLVELEKGFIKTDENMNAGHPGLYAVGDCRVKKVRQVVTATSDGAIAATDDANYLSKKA